MKQRLLIQLGTMGEAAFFNELADEDDDPEENDVYIINSITIITVEIETPAKDSDDEPKTP